MSDADSTQRREGAETQRARLEITDPRLREIDHASRTLNAALGRLKAIESEADLVRSQIREAMQALGRAAR